MRTHALDDGLRGVIAEVHRRRVVNGKAPSLEQTTVEVTLPVAYGRAFQVDDMTGGYRTEILPMDLDGRRIRVMLVKRWPVRVYSRGLDCDAIVVAGLAEQTVTFYGWLPESEVEEAPVFWFERDGQRVDYSHEVDRLFLIPMPVEFTFVDPCEHEDWGALWDYSYAAWQCFGCRRFRYSDEARERVRRQDAYLGYSDPLSTNKEGSVR